MYVFAAVAPAVGKLVTLVLPEASTEMMTLFLEEVSRTFADFFLVIKSIKLAGIVPRRWSCRPTSA
jgi:hypothetical protein